MSQASCKLNGNIYDFTSVSITMNDTPIVKGVFSEFNWEASQDPGMAQGNQVSVWGYTAGNATGSGSFKMLADHFDDFTSELLDAGWLDFMGVDFDVVISFSANKFGPTPTNDMRTIELQGVRITKYGESPAKGNDANYANCDVIIHRIIKNGSSAFGAGDDLSPF